MASLKKRGDYWLIQFYVAGQQRRLSTGTDNYQVAKEKLRQFESAQAQGDGNSLPTKTPIPDIVGRYVDYMRTRKTAKSAQTDVYYLREAFGPICPQLQVTSRRLSQAAKKRPLLPGAKQDLRRRAMVIEANSFEQITTLQVAAFITGQVQSRGLAPKTANRYREILCRLFNWSMEEGGVRIAGDKNPVLKVSRYKEHAPDISFLTLAQIDEQIAALANHLQVQVMVAVLIYAGLRREELLWLKGKTISNGLIIVKQLLNWASNGHREYLAKNPLAHCKVERVQSPPAFTPSPDQVHALIDLAIGERKLQFTMLAMTGLRAGELAMLRVEDVDVAKGWIHVVGRDDWDPKTVNSMRKIPIHPVLAALLKAAGPRKGPYFFCAEPSNKYPAGGHFINIKHLNELLHRLAKRSGAPVGRKNQGFVVHSLRHYFETQCVDAATPQFVVDAWMGHSRQTKMGSTYYGHSEAKSHDYMQRVVF